MVSVSLRFMEVLVNHGNVFTLGFYFYFFGSVFFDGGEGGIRVEC